MASKPIVAGTDGSAASLRAVDWAAREAVLHGVPLRIVAAAAVLRRMSARRHASGSRYDTVSDVLLEERDAKLVMQHLADLWGYDVVMKEIDPATDSVLKEHAASPRGGIISHDAP